MDLAGKKITVVGLGASGAAAARLCLARGARVTATDLAAEPAGAAGLAQAGAELVLGRHRASDFTGADLVVLSPGVDHTKAEPKAAAEAGVEVIGELELAYRFCDAPLAAVTGTNGKSTVTTVLGQMLAKSGQRVFVGGNLGEPLCELVNQRREVDWAVVEVSSFQTDTAPTLAPSVGVLLNISDDHLDRYDGFVQYAASKISMFTRQSGDMCAVLCADDPEVMSRAGLPGGEVWLYGENGPHRPGGWLRRDEMILDDAVNPPLILGLAASPLVGRFNRANLLASALAARACGAGAQAIQEVIASFAGLPHRLVLAAEVDGVAYYDDSKGTNVGAVIAAINALERPLVLLLGGRDKEGRFTQLAPALAGRVKKVICFGEAGPSIHEQIGGFAASQVVRDLPEAVRLARASASPGWGVLLSPGCASFDAYNSYAQRGDHFQSLVREMNHA